MLALLCVLVIGVLSYVFLVKEKYAPTAGSGNSDSRDKRMTVPLGMPLTPGPARN